MRERERGSREARTLSSFCMEKSREFRGLFISRALYDVVGIGGGRRIDSKGRSRVEGTVDTLNGSALV